jgi:cytochrome c oxidase cbb3-type subunit 3
MRLAQHVATAICTMAIVLTLLSCEREERQFRLTPPAATRVHAATLSELHPGSQPPASATENPYEENAYTLSEGKRLYQWFNCVGCHAHGGGAIGPPLTDDLWIYGSNPENIFASIVEGRPNGMPSFRGKIPEDLVWQLAAYVRSLSGLVPKDAAPGRSDHMNAKGLERSEAAEPPHMLANLRHRSRCRDGTRVAPRRNCGVHFAPDDCPALRRVCGGAIGARPSRSSGLPH